MEKVVGCLIFYCIVDCCLGDIAVCYLDFVKVKVELGWEVELGII